MNNILAIKNPELSKQWHPTLNEDLTPNDVTCYSNKKVWWQCSKNKEHIWKSTIYNRHCGNGCPYCIGRLVSDNNRLSIINPKLSKQWHPTLNGGLTPFDFSYGSSKEIWW